MKRFRLQIIFVVVALIAAGCQCSMACAVERDGAASEPSNEQLPPCHQDQQSNDSKNSRACLHTPFVLDNRAAAPTTPEFARVLPTTILSEQGALSAALASQQREIREEISPPPSPELVNSKVLRL
jgi:hypothetical protein